MTMEKVFLVGNKGSIHIYKAVVPGTNSLCRRHSYEKIRRNTYVKEKGVGELDFDKGFSGVGSFCSHCVNALKNRLKKEKAEAEVKVQ